MKKKILSIVAGVTTALLTLSACAPTAGGAGTGTGTGNASAGGFVQGVTDDSITIANSVAVSGPLAPVGAPFQAGMNAYIEKINSEGGVHGRRIVYLHTDDGFDPAQGVAALEGFIHDDEVFAIVGQFGTPVIGATFPTLVESGIPVVYFAGGIGIVYNENATDGDGRNTFPIQPVFPMEGRIFAAWAAGEFDANTIALIHTNDDAGADFLFGVTQEVNEINAARTATGQEPIELVTVQVPPGAEDVTAQVATVIAAHPDVVIAGSIQGTIAQILNTLADQGNTAPVLTSYVNADGTITNLVWPQVSGQFDVYASSWVDMTRPEMEDFRHWVAQVSNEDLSNNSFAMTGWIAMSMFVEGLERAGRDLTWGSFIEAMESAPVQNPFGPAIDFSNGSRVGTNDLALLRMNGNDVVGWEGFLPFMSISEILGH